MSAYKHKRLEDESRGARTQGMEGGSPGSAVRVRLRLRRVKSESAKLLPLPES